MNKCIVRNLVLLLAIWQISKCEAKRFDFINIATKEIDQKSKQFDQKIKKNMEVVQSEVTTVFTELEVLEVPEEPTTDTKNEDEDKTLQNEPEFTTEVPTSQPELFPKMSLMEVINMTMKTTTTTPESSTLLTKITKKLMKPIYIVRRVITAAARCPDSEGEIMGGCYPKES